MKNILLIILMLATQNILADSDTFMDRSLDGVYDMNIQIGNQKFTDILELSGRDGIIKMVSFGGKIKGSVTVQNSFTSPLSGNARCTLWGSFCELEFDIVAHENGQNFKVHYQAQVIREDYLKMLDGSLVSTIRGSANLESGQVLGNFVAVMRK